MAHDMPDLASDLESVWPPRTQTLMSAALAAAKRRTNLSLETDVGPCLLLPRSGGASLEVVGFWPRID